MICDMNTCYVVGFVVKRGLCNNFIALFIVCNLHHLLTSKVFKSAIFLCDKILFMESCTNINYAECAFGASFAESSTHSGLV